MKLGNYPLKVNWLKSWRRGKGFQIAAHKFQAFLPKFGEAGFVCRVNLFNPMRKVIHHGDVRKRFSVCAALAFIFGMVSVFADVPLPQINTNNIIIVTDAPYNAIGDGITTNTTAIQNAINAAASGGTINGLSGGTVEIPPGVYLSGPLTMKSSVNLQIDGGAILRMLPYDKYPGGIVNPANFISASKLHDIEIKIGRASCRDRV